MVKFRSQMDVQDVHCVIKFIPEGVYEMDSNVDVEKTQLNYPKKWVNCNACVLHCPENCLEVIK